MEPMSKNESQNEELNSTAGTYNCLKVIKPAPSIILNIINKPNKIQDTPWLLDSNLS